MTRILLLLTLLAGSCLGQTFTQYTPTVMGVAVGSTHCTFWFHTAPKWDVEVACYGQGGDPIYMQVNTPAAMATVASFNVPNVGSITWQIENEAGNGVYVYHIQANDIMTIPGLLTMVASGTI